MKPGTDGTVVVNGTLMGHYLIRTYPVDEIVIFPHEGLPAVKLAEFMLRGGGWVMLLPKEITEEDTKKRAVLTDPPLATVRATNAELG